MRTRYIAVVVVLVTLAVAAVVVYAGSLDSTGAPTDTAGQMYTLEQIYDRINDGTAATKMDTFGESSSGPTAGTGKTLDDIYTLAGQRARAPKTGQTTCYNWDGDTISCANTGQDGELQKGVAWPNPRFTDNSNGTVTDNLTGLIWLKNANCYGGRSWWSALSDANALANGTCGLSDGSSAGDWRLPNVRELQSLIHYGCNVPALPDTAGTGCWSGSDPFTGVLSGGYWTSTTYASNADFAWYVGPSDGGVLVSRKVSMTDLYVWPVRGGQ